MVEQSSEQFLLPFLCCFSHTVQPLGHALPALCRAHVRNDVLLRLCPSHSRIAWLPYCLPPTRNGVGILIRRLFAAQLPRPPMPLSTLQDTPHDVPCKTRGQDGFATSFPVGLLHPLQHAGLSRRTPVGRRSRSDHKAAPIEMSGTASSPETRSRGWERQLRPESSFVD